MLPPVKAPPLPIAEPAGRYRPDGWHARARRMPSLGWVVLALAVITLAWLTIVAPPWKLRAEPASQSVTYLAADGSVIARKGEEKYSPVEAVALPEHVIGAFTAIEDRAFFRHPGFDLKGMARAGFNNLKSGGVVEGGSTITQQYAKRAFLNDDRTYTRKAKEMLLAVWLEIWLSKQEILSRYLGSAYFGDGAYGLTAAAQTYFDKEARALSVGEAAMLAGLVKAPSRLSPRVDRTAARERMRVVLGAMADAEVIGGGEARTTPDPRLRDGREAVPTGTYFADWLAERKPEPADGIVQTTLDPELQQRATAALSRARLGNAQAALVAMRPDGRIVAMVGGRSYARSPYNRATQAKRQPGSAFKLFVYLAAMRAGARPDDLVADAPVTIDGWEPENADKRYRGLMPLRDAFALSSNVAAVRVAEAAGRAKVIQTARDLGVTADLPETPSVALGTGTMPLIELTAAYAAIAGGGYPVVPVGSGAAKAPAQQLEPEVRAAMLDLLWQAANLGTGRDAALSQPTFGKTGTSQDGRDALFVGFAGDVVAGVWIGRDDNGAIGGLSGGGLPAAIWREFMGGARLRAVNAAPERREVRERRGGREGRGRGKGRGKGKKRR